ncbi:MAG: alpha-N-arabinofuranosidase [Actinobacteria bacterium]|nr:alpha-N-arabinofuranosidase [Actinomycetota bacterium]MBU1608774.1 alpha-N-arabinofuranosidase [Actinomycetota bacterium]MBU2314837.1 alpha-N-arabinofuranosidase [Actinomycetota bacterium]MBU2385835.1 alpha-N-arabinofuranosidase [Actinomycetota bacterium]
MVSPHTRITVHPSFVRGEIDRRIFGSFVEHLGRAVYTGIYEPGHPTADGEGFRGDVAELTRELGTTVVRYPGGNFVSNYVWEDGVGPREDRPTRIDLAWRTIERNEVGTDEFLAWTRATGTEPMMAVNLGTRGADAAANLVEYCNVAGGTSWSERRRSNGAEHPYGIRLWCLGNEMDGPWQIGHKTADDYGKLASQAAQAMRRVDPSIQLVVCGSSSRVMPTFGEWERVVLEHTFDDVDYISVHAYYQERNGDRASFLASGASFEAFLHEVIATADAVAARRHSQKRIRLSVDEWNVWYIDDFAGEDNLDLHERPRLIEDVYSTIDAVVVGDLLGTLLRNADRVAIACLAQLVNVIAPIMTEPGGEAWRQTTFFPLALLAQHARGVALDARTDSPTLVTAQHGEVDAVSSVVTWDAEAGALVIGLTNRTTEPVQTTVDHLGFADVALVEARAIVADHEGPRRTAEEARAAEPRPLEGVAVDGAATTLTLPPESWTLVWLSARASG